MRTNDTISIYKVVKDWKGAISSSTLLGDYEVWREHGECFEFKTYNSQVIRHKVGDGFFIMKDDIDLSDTYTVIDGVRYEITPSEKLYKRNGDFHHAEAYYK